MALSQTGAGDAGLCDRAAIAAAAATDVPAKVLLAISRVETGRSSDGQFSPWPWTVNLEGEGAYFPTKAAAADFVRNAVAAGSRNMDIGCFQVNLRWHGSAFASPQDMLDPDRNALYAARFLSGLHAEHGTWAGAIGAYHSATPALADRYLAKVAVILNAPSVAPTPEPPTDGAQTGPAPRDNRFPLLRGGTGRRLGSLVATDSTAAVLPLFR
ncbi:MAG: transglycosylase SLT domain-containing protein [Rhodobacteraceae bacterium]|nr:transglycosylase SLT domain-containing protein [Paracoccaceae bacterium]